ncbi:MAG: VOC family protein [Devosia sp.]
MTIKTVTHLNFRGQAKAALQFYQSVFDGELVAVTYADAHAAQEPAEADQVMWGQVTSADGFAVMAYDVPGRLPFDAGEGAFFVSLRGETAMEVSDYWAKLAEGATILAPLAPSGWAPLYGMLKDRFGVTWVFDVAVTYQPA